MLGEMGPCKDVVGFCYKLSIFICLFLFLLSGDINEMLDQIFQYRPFSSESHWNIQICKKISFSANRQ